MGRILKWLRNLLKPRPTPTPTPAMSSMSWSTDTLNNRLLLHAHNRMRVAEGLGALTINVILCKTAQTHAEEMASRQLLSHIGVNGSTAWSRASANGYVWNTFGENIADGQKTAAAVMASWMNSSEHKANILNGSFKDVGFGMAATASNGVVYWCVDFGA